MAQLSLTKFKQLVADAINNLPDNSKKYLENIQVIVDLSPTEEQLLGTGLENKLDLLSLYEGIHSSERYGYEDILPDKITIFQESLESLSTIESELVKEIQLTINAEISQNIRSSQDLS